MFKIRKEVDISQKYLLPGDTLTLHYTESGNDEVLLADEVKEYMEIDRVAIFDLEDEFGMEKGIGGAFGKKIRR